MKVSIQFVNYKTRRYLVECLASLLPQLKNAPFEWAIHILDNASGDNLDDLVSDKIYVWYHDKNEGFGAGHNILSQKSGSDYLLILNTDLLFKQEDAAVKLVQASIQQNADIIGPLLMTAKGTPQHWDHGELPEGGVLGFLRDFTGRYFWKERHDAAEVAWVSGAVLLIKTDLYRKLRGFDEDFFLYHEEVDLCYRARRLGAKVWYEPEVQVVHFGGVVADINKYTSESSRIYLQKSFS